MKAKKKSNGSELYTSIKIRTEHYLMAKEHKEKTGVNIDFFVGQAIEEKIEREKKQKI